MGQLNLTFPLMTALCGGAVGAAAASIVSPVNPDYLGLGFGGALVGLLAGLLADWFDDRAHTTDAEIQPPPSWGTVLAAGGFVLALIGLLLSAFSVAAGIALAAIGIGAGGCGILIAAVASAGSEDS
jgi:hypothetical protein